MPQQRMAGISHVAQSDTSKGPIFRVATTDGVEYSTFNGALANQARQLAGQNVLLSFTEKHVNKDGRDYINRYYEGAEPANGGGGFTGTQPANMGGGGVEMPQLSFGNNTGGPIQTTPNVPEASRETRIMRQTASKVAAHMLVYLPEGERTPDGLVAIAEYLVSYYEDGPRTASQDFATADDIPF